MTNGTKNKECRSLRVNLGLYVQRTTINSSKNVGVKESEQEWNKTQESENRNPKTKEKKSDFELIALKKLGEFCDSGHEIGSPGKHYYIPYISSNLC